jgi:hypothetical protein
MDADLDLLLIAVFCTADDLLPERKKNARRRLTEAEVVALGVARSIMGICSDERLVRVAHRRLRHLFPGLTGRSGFHRRRDRLADVIEALIEVFAARSPAYRDDLLPSPTRPGGVRPLAGDREARRGELPGRRARRRRRLRLLRLAQPLVLRLPPSHPDGARRDGPARWRSPRLRRASARSACGFWAGWTAKARSSSSATRAYAGSDFKVDAAELGAIVVGPRRKDVPEGGPHLAPLRQRLESIHRSAKDILALERHGARTLRGLRVRIAARFLVLAAAVSLNHELGRDSRALVDYVAWVVELLIKPRDVPGAMPVLVLL